MEQIYEVELFFKSVPRILSWTDARHVIAMNYSNTYWNILAQEIPNFISMILPYVYAVIFWSVS